MASMRFYMITLFFATLLSFLCFSTSVSASTPLLEGICKSTINHAKCLKALQSDNRAISASDLQDLAPIALRIALANANASATFMEHMLKRNDSEPIRQCHFWYKQVALEFQIALRELNAKERTMQNVMGASYCILTAGDHVRQCEEALLYEGVRLRSISARNKAVKIYVSIGDVITSQLQTLKKTTP